MCILQVAIVMPYISAQSARLATRIGARATVILDLLCLAAGFPLLWSPPPPPPEARPGQRPLSTDPLTMSGFMSQFT